MRCVPAGPGERNDCLWSLARTLKGFPHLACAAAEHLTPYFAVWYGVAKRVIGTKSRKECWGDFKRQWKLARVPMGVGFDAAMSAALARPYPQEAERYTRPVVRNLVAVCAALQEYAGDGAFYLSCRTARQVCDFGTHVTAWNWLNRLCKEKLLVVVEKGVSGTTLRRATRYRWLPATAPGAAPGALARAEGQCDRLEWRSGDSA